MNGLTALVIDDEKESRDGLTQIIPWRELGVELVLEATHGQEGLEMALQYKPQLIFTDIMMPHMNGIELMKVLQRNRWGGSIIVVTAHDDFQFVREALRLGAYDYILKPFRLHEVLPTVTQCIEDLKLEQLADLQAREEKAKYQEALALLQEKTVSDLLASRTPDPERFKKRIEQVRLGWMLHQPLITLAIEIDNLGSLLQDQSDAEKNLLLFAIGNVAKDSIPRRFPFYLWRSPVSSHWLAIIATEEKEQLRGMADAMIANIGTYVKLSVSIGIGLVCKFEGLSFSYAASLESLAYKALLGGNQALFSDEVMLHKPSPFMQETPLEQELLSVLKAGLPEQVDGFYARFADLIQTWGEKNRDTLHNRLFEWLLRMERGLRATHPGVKVVGDDAIRIWKQFQGFDTLDGNIRYTLRLLAEMATVCKLWQQKQLSQITQKALLLIETEYAHDLTIGDVAERVYVSSVWLSHLLKEDTGRTFLELLTACRIAKAKELLGDVALKAYEIADRVGYRDTDYFTKVFKKHVGMTPSEYRNTVG